MNSKGIVASAASQSRTSTGVTPTDGLCLFAPLVIFLTTLGWTIWDMRLAKPMAFVMFAGLMVAVLVLGLIHVLTRLSDELRKATSIGTKQLDPFYEFAPLTSLTVATLERKNRKPC